jgi:choline dehydrogenase-like flavoprotein
MKVFDYIVASDSTAGSVFAPQLSQDPGTRVLLVEAGSANGIPRELG